MKEQYNRLRESDEQRTQKYKQWNRDRGLPLVSNIFLENAITRNDMPEEEVKFVPSVGTRNRMLSRDRNTLEDRMKDYNDSQ
jgi:hypothetical protein